MKILLSNDDGFNAEGINELFVGLNNDHKVMMIAPDQERSSCGHGITLTSPIRMNTIDQNIFSCSGTPADCILVGVGKFNKPDLVISGINHGANLGQDRFYSGTIAAAREAAFRDIPSIAISLYQYSSDLKNHFHNGPRFIKELIKSGIASEIPNKTLININLPNTAWEKIEGAKLCVTGHQIYSDDIIERIDTRGNSYFWVGGKYEGHLEKNGTDASAVAAGHISVDLQYFYHDTQTQMQEFRQRIEEVLIDINKEHFSR